MGSIFKRILAPTLALITIMIGVSYLSSFLSLRMVTDGYPLFYSGILYSSYCGGMMVGALYLKTIIFVKGHSRSFSIFAGSISLVILLQSFTLLPEIWILFRFLTGIAAAGLFIVIESWILLLSNKKNRGIALAIYMVAIYLGQCVGQYGLSLVPINSVLPFNLALFFCVAAILPICSIKTEAPTLQESKSIHAIELLKKIPLGFLGNLTSGLLLGAFYALGPVYAKHSGHSLLQIATIMAVTIFGGMTLQWPLGKLSDIFPRRHIIILICILTCVFSILLTIYHKHSFIVQLQLLFLLGGFLFTLYPISITYCCDFYDETGLTSISAAALLYYGLGCIIGPIFASIFMFFSPAGLFVYFAILSLLLGIFAIYQQQNAPAPPKEHEENFKAHPGIQENFGDTD